jgi:hypothetical protein
MYFIELIVKKFRKKEKIQDSYDPMKEEEREEESCEHIFMPIDSSGEILSCRNCGQIVHRKDLKDINFFRQ